MKEYNKKFNYNKKSELFFMLKLSLSHKKCNKLRVGQSNIQAVQNFS